MLKRARDPRSKPEVGSCFAAHQAHDAIRWRAADEAQDPDAADIKWLFRIGRRNRWRIFSALLLNLLAGIAYIKFTIPQYQATAQLYLDTREAPLVDLSGRLQQQPVENTFVESQLEIIRSPHIAELALREIGTHPQHNQMPAKPGGPVELNANPATDKHITELLRRLSVKRKGQTNILELNYLDPRPERAAEVVNSILKVYIDAQIAAASEAVEVKRRAIQAEVNALQKEVTRVEQAIQDVQTENKLAWVPAEGLGARQLADLVQQLATARSQRETIAARMRQLNPTSIVPMSDRRAVPGEDSRQLEALQAELAAATKTVAELEDAFGKMRQKVTTYQRRSIEIGEMERQANAARTVYSVLLTKLREAEAQENLIVPLARIVFSARAPDRPSKPDIPMTLLIALAGGTVTAIALVTWREATNNAFLEEEDAEKLLGLKCLAHLPHVDLTNRTDVKRKETPVAIRPVASKGIALPGIESGARHSPPQLFALSGSPQSWRYAQALFLMRSGIVPQNSSPRVAVVVSPTTGTGRSSLVLNFGAYSAAGAMKTLVVDCDTRNPELSTHFRAGVMGSPKGAAPIETDLLPLRTFRTGLGFDFCAAADELPAAFPMDKTASRELRSFIAGARQTHELILLDTPPLLEYVDSRAIIPFADVVLLLIDWHHTTQSDALKAMEIISAAGGQWVEVVISHSPRRSRKKQ